MPRKLRNAVRQRPKSAITGSRIIPIVNSPNFRPSISTINAPSLLTAPFPLISTRDDKSNRRRRRPHLLASNIHVPSRSIAHRQGIMTPLLTSKALIRHKLSADRGSRDSYSIVLPEHHLTSRALKTMDWMC